MLKPEHLARGDNLRLVPHHRLQQACAVIDFFKNWPESPPQSYPLQPAIEYANCAKCGQRFVRPRPCFGPARLFCDMCFTKRST